MDAEARHQEICHHMRNGLVVIRALVVQIRKGNLSRDDGLAKIEHRCLEIETSLKLVGSKER